MAHTVLTAYGSCLSHASRYGRRSATWSPPLCVACVSLLSGAVSSPIHHSTISGSSHLASGLWTWIADSWRKYMDSASIVV